MASCLFIYNFYALRLNIGGLNAQGILMYVSFIWILG